MFDIPRFEEGLAWPLLSLLFLYLYQNCGKCTAVWPACTKAAYEFLNTAVPICPHQEFEDLYFKARARGYVVKILT